MKLKLVFLSFFMVVVMSTSMLATSIPVPPVSIPLPWGTTGKLDELFEDMLFDFDYEGFSEDVSLYTNPKWLKMKAMYYTLLAINEVAGRFSYGGHQGVTVSQKELQVMAYYYTFQQTGNMAVKIITETNLSAKEAEFKTWYKKNVWFDSSTKRYIVTKKSWSELTQSYVTQEVPCLTYNEIFKYIPSEYLSIAKAMQTDYKKLEIGAITTILKTKDFILNDGVSTSYANLPSKYKWETYFPNVPRYQYMYVMTGTGTKSNYFFIGTSNQPVYGYGDGIYFKGNSNFKIILHINGTPYLQEGVASGLELFCPKGTTYNAVWIYANSDVFTGGVLDRANDEYGFIPVLPSPAKVGIPNMNLIAGVADGELGLDDEAVDELTDVEGVTEDEDEDVVFVPPIAFPKVNEDDSEGTGVIPDASMMMDSFLGKMGTSQLKATWERFYQLQQSNIPPKFTINLNGLFNASSSIHGQKDAFGPGVNNATFLDFVVMEQYTFAGFTLIEYMRTAISAGLILHTARYVWKKIIPDKVVAG